MLAEEYDCQTGPFKFHSDHSRFTYFQSEGTRDPSYHAHDDCLGEMVMMCGLPGAGKDTWIKNNLPNYPRISLDNLRAELGVEPGENQGPVIARARESAKGLMRKNTSFVLNATSLVEQLRGFWISLASAYHFRTRIVYLEVPLPVLLRRNKERPEAARVPEHIIRKMMTKWEMPDQSEAHSVEYHYQVAP
jgi:predicted kinase